METVGVIGAGNMGSMLIEVMLEQKAVSEEKMHVFNRTYSKSQSLKDKFTSIHTHTSVKEIVQEASMLFLCIRPGDYEGILPELRKHLTGSHTLLTITSPVSGEELDSLPCRKTGRVVPTILNKTGNGPFLVTFGNNWGKEEKQFFMQWLNTFGSPVEIEEECIRAASDIVSCGPAFFSFLLEQFIQAAVKETQISKEEAEMMTEQMIICFGNLLDSGVYNLQTLKEKVNVPGGITGAGLGVLRKKSAGMFEEVFQTTHSKFREDKGKMEPLFNK
ncbi:late competence protein ComER [Alteribacillus sp. HJP-4]|uniref:late competence protein ComER n=1 Tax=Alteribacillus sp. HJP-4 TaxID=2775394 RepID=UPI0035CCD561